MARGHLRKLQMARFLKHTACSVCGSSDALAHYEDGSTYCFSHGRSTKQASISPFVTASRQQEDAEMHRLPVLPKDATQDYPVQALAWTEKYEIGVELLLRNKVYYSGARNQLIFSFLDGEGKVLAYQARNLSAVSKARRYYTQGDINGILPIYYANSNSSKHVFVQYGATSGRDLVIAQRCRRLVLVEDCLSAIKTASIGALGADAMPLLGSTLSLRKLTALRASYDLCDVFLDPDMWHHSLKIAQQAQMLGFTARSIRAECDPKELTRESLCQLLK